MTGMTAGETDLNQETTTGEDINPTFWGVLSLSIKSFLRVKKIKLYN